MKYLRLGFVAVLAIAAIYSEPKVLILDDEGQTWRPSAVDTLKIREKILADPDNPDGELPDDGFTSPDGFFWPAMPRRRAFFTLLDQRSGTFRNYDRAAAESHWKWQIEQLDWWKRDLVDEDQEVAR